MKLVNNSFQVQYREVGHWYNTGRAYDNGLDVFKEALAVANATHCDVRIISLITGEVIS